MAVANSQRRGRTIPGLMNLSSYPYASDKRRCLPFQPKVSALSARHSRLANASVDLSCDAANRHAIGIGAGAALEPAGTAIRCQGGPAVLREGCGWGEVLRHAGGEPIGRVCRPVRNVFRPAAADDAGPVGLTSSYAICSYGADRVEHLRADSIGDRAAALWGDALGCENFRLRLARLAGRTDDLAPVVAALTKVGSSGVEKAESIPVSGLADMEAAESIPVGALTEVLQRKAPVTRSASHCAAASCEAAEQPHAYSLFAELRRVFE